MMMDKDKVANQCKKKYKKNVLIKRMIYLIMMFLLIDQYVRDVYDPFKLCDVQYKNQ